MTDAYKQQRPGATPIKNPLLSASVTGLTFDDFPNKPLLLPAAPPIVHAPVVTPVVTLSGLVAKEPKSLVTVGSSSLDTDNLDEINLNESNPTSDVIDPNANPLLEPSNQGGNKDSIISQAASSFSALPAVASNVFSTFSKRITAISSRETSPIYDQRQQDLNANALDPQPTYPQQSLQGHLSQTSTSYFYPPPLGGNNITSTSHGPDTTQTPLQLVEPPKFYTPADIPQVPSAPPPSNSGGQNNFRFTSKKKLYAPIPGLSDQTQNTTTTLDPSNVNPSSTNYYPPATYSIPQNQQKEQKSEKDLFPKLKILSPNSVLQNITGFVQSAAESLTQTNKSDTYQQAPPPTPPTVTTFDQTNNCFTSPLPPVNYFPPVVNTGVQNTQHPFIGGPAIESPNLIFSHPNPSNNFQSPLQASTNTNSNCSLLTPSETSATGLFDPSQSNLTEPVLTTAGQAFFDPANYLSHDNQAGLISPPTQSKPPPASGHTSYRLQKGTKLYKNPLTQQATAPIEVTPNQIQATNTYSSQDSISTSQNIPLFFSSSAEHVSGPPLAQGPQSIVAPPPLPFAVEPLASKSDHSVPFFSTNQKLQTIPLFDPSANPNQKNKSLAIHGDELKTEEEVNISFAPPIKKLKSDESVELEQGSGKQNVTDVPKRGTTLGIVDDWATQKIFETIEPVLEEDITEEPTDPLEETLQKLSLAESSLQQSQALKLPPIAESFNVNNRFTKASTTETGNPTQILPTLANFFTPDSSSVSGNSNFFAPIPVAESSDKGVNFFSDSVQNNETKKVETVETENKNFFAAPLEPATAVDPPITAFFPNHPPSSESLPTEYLNESPVYENVPPPIGFESFTQTESTITEPQQATASQTQEPEVVSRFTNYFNQTNQESEIAKDPSTFFDTLAGQRQHQIEVTAPSVVTNEEQRIQYFFNNPPPQNASCTGDLNYDLVHSGLGIKNLQQRSLTPISNLVEPPSSVCSEFSELSNSTAGQKSIAANLSITESAGKEETAKSLIEEPDSSITSIAELPEEFLKELRMANLISADNTPITPAAAVSYKPAIKHWFYKRKISDKTIWLPFSHYDSALLETSLLMPGEDKQNIVAVEGGRYDVNIKERKKTSVYWDSEPIEVRRCSWFYKTVESTYVPYEEQTADVLENEYKQAAESGVWHKNVYLETGEKVVYHGPAVIVHYQQQQNADAWGGTTQSSARPRVVKRDLDDFKIEQGESQRVDHLLFMVHGIGSACDLKFRPVEEVVEDFRTIARQLVQSHYKNSFDLGLVGRVEVLPISWHSHLHSVEMGIDEKLRTITLESIPRLRNFTNDTLLDILFYTSPTYCQKIMNTITSSMNSLYLKYRERNPDFNGGVSLAGHSLGSLILFDLLCHQHPIKESEDDNLEKADQVLTGPSRVTQMDTNQLEDKPISYTVGPAGTGQPFIDYGQLIFQPKKFFALGSPIGMFVTIRGIDKLGLDFRLPTCSGFYNIFHPYDPVAYRIEALVNPDLSDIRPVLIPHHKGRKRMHLELKETMARISLDLKNRFLDKFKTTLESVNIFGSTSKSTKEAEELMQKEVDKVIQMQIEAEEHIHNENSNRNLPSGSDFHSENTAEPRQRTQSVSTVMSDDLVEIDFPLGKLNDSKRIDYVLQEAPLELINEYLFALRSHVCYWDSEDTILFVMKEIYSGLGISPDSQVPQQTMTIERPSSRNSSLSYS